MTCIHDVYTALEEIFLAPNFQFLFLNTSKLMIPNLLDIRLPNILMRTTHQSVDVFFLDSSDKFTSVTSVCWS